MLLQIQEPGGKANMNSPTGVVVGIDFGTTNSVVSISRNGSSSVIPIQGLRLVPSIISYKEGKGEVGRMDEKESGFLVHSIKRSMEPKGTSGFIDIVLENTSKTPIQISSDILRYLKTEAEKALGESITGAVITVPAYYSEIAREATRMAAQLAGIPVLRLLSEPTAAALAYQLDEEEGEYLIYDLGGGTFDVSVLRVEKGIFQVLSVKGDMLLGGDDVDKALLDFMNLGGVEHIFLARSIKEYLTNHPVWQGLVEGKNIKVTREELNFLLSPFIKRTLDLCNEALIEASLRKDQLKAIVLVGGSTRVPYFQKEIKDFFGKEPLCRLNPDEVVSLGAALHAEALKTGKGKLLLDVTPFSLGIETLGGAVEVLIPHNSPLPAAVSERFTTSHDGQTKIKIHVVQGEGKKVEDCQSLGTFILNIPPFPAGQVELKVTFILDADGILSVSAEERCTGIKQSIQVKPSYSI